MTLSSPPRPPARPASPLFLGAALAVLAGSPAPASAQPRTEPAGRVHGATLERIYDGNRFTRCRATLDAPQGRLAFDFDGRDKYQLSIPLPPQSPPPATIALVIGPAPLPLRASVVGDRLAADLDIGALQRLLTNAGALVVQVGTTRWEWPDAPLEGVFSSMETCAGRALRAR